MQNFFGGLTQVQRKFYFDINIKQESGDSQLKLTSLSQIQSTYIDSKKDYLLQMSGGMSSNETAFSLRGLYTTPYTTPHFSFSMDYERSSENSSSEDIVVGSFNGKSFNDLEGAESILDSTFSKYNLEEDYFLYVLWGGFSSPENILE